MPSSASFPYACGQSPSRIPTRCAQALAVLDEILSWIESFNADPNNLSFVDEVWRFGSLMQGEATVGDVDLAIGTSPPPEYWGQVKLMIKRAADLCDERDVHWLKPGSGIAASYCS
jgi:hypothetical protein